MAETLKINEIYSSVQGESLLAGKPSVFVRTAICRARFDGARPNAPKDEEWKGALLEVDEILAKVNTFESEYVAVVGEPLGQKNTYLLLQRLLQEGYIVSLEVSGDFSIRDVPNEVIKIVDISCPESTGTSLAWENLDLVQAHDQVKFSVGSRADFEWSRKVCEDHELDTKCAILFAPLAGKVSSSELAGWVLSTTESVPVATEVQKQIWGPTESES